MAFSCTWLPNIYSPTVKSGKSSPIYPPILALLLTEESLKNGPVARAKQPMVTWRKIQRGLIKLMVEISICRFGKLNIGNDGSGDRQLLLRFSGPKRRK